MNAIICDEIPASLEDVVSFRIVDALKNTCAKEKSEYIPEGEARKHIAILDLGSTENARIAREVRKLGVYSEIHPHDIAPDALKALLELKEVSEPLEALKRVDILLYGIARADDMADNRLTDRHERDRLVERGATAEALGFCFDSHGRYLAAASAIGVPIDAVQSIPHVIGVAAGARKAEAILAVTRHHKHDMLVIDEGAALAIASLIREDR